MVETIKKFYKTNLIKLMVTFYSLYYILVIAFTLAQVFSLQEFKELIFFTALIISLFFYSYKQVGKKINGLSYFIEYSGMIILGWFQVIFPIMLLKFIFNLIEWHQLDTFLLALSQLLFLYALINGHRKPRLVKVEFKSSKIKTEIKIVQLTDVHLGMLYLDETWLSQLVMTIESLSPDLVCITGDLIEGNIKNFENEFKLLRGLKAFYTTGNHEFLYNTPIEIQQMIEKASFSDLNEKCKVIHEINVLGIQDLSQYSSISKISVTKLIDPERFNLLLCHQSLALNRISETDKRNIDLVLSGHTHGCQIFPYGYLDLFIIPSVRGMYVDKNYSVYTSAGVGFWGAPLRYFSNAEISLITIKPDSLV